MTAVLQACRLHKKYGDVVAVADVSFELVAGRCLALLGPNGAGKSTTIEMLEGLVRPTSGEVHYRGRPLDRHYRSRIGLQFQTTSLQDFLTVRENLAFFGALYPRRAPLEELVEACHLASFLDRDPRHLSGGQRQRLLLAIALINEPDLVFLDEPTTGLDPQARRNFWDLIERVKARGTTILLTTHYMDEAHALADDIAIMDHGRIIARGTAQSLLAEHFSDSIFELPLSAISEQSLPVDVVRRADAIEITSDDIEGTVRTLMQSGVPLERLRIRTPTLEDLFLRLTGEGLRA